MRFRSKGKPAGEILQRQQRRIGLIIVGAGIIAVLLSTSGKSGWLTSLFTEEPPVAAKPPAIADSLLGSGELRPDEFKVVPTASPMTAEDYASMIDREGAAKMESAEFANSSEFADVPLQLTRTIRDNVLGVLSTESDAWFGTLRLASRISSKRRHLAPEGQFSLFMDSPQSCRGKAFVIRGRLRRLLKAPLPPGAETFGVKSAYDAWISTRDSGNQLVHVVALAADAGLPLTEHTGREAPEIEVTGYFFKLEGYAAKGPDGQGELALTPLILAGRIHYAPTQVTMTRSSQMNPWLTSIGIAVCFAVLMIVWRFQVSDTSFRGTRTHQLTVLPVKASFEGVQSVTVQEALHDMQENAQRLTPDANLLS